MDWTTLPLKKYNEIKDVYLDPEYTDEDRLLAQVQIVFEIDPYKLPVTQLKDYISKLSFFEKKVPTMKVKETYNLGGNIYKLKKNLKDFTVAQWLDWQNYLKNGSGPENFANLLSVFFFPNNNDEYGEYDIEQVKSDISNYLSIADALSISSFFLNYRKALSILFLLYTKRITLKTPLTRKQRKEVRKEIRKALKTTLIGDSHHS